MGKHANWWPQEWLCKCLKHAQSPCASLADWKWRTGTHNAEAYRVGLLLRGHDWVAWTQDANTVQPMGCRMKAQGCPDSPNYMRTSTYTSFTTHSTVQYSTVQYNTCGTMHVYTNHTTHTRVCMDKQAHTHTSTSAAFFTMDAANKFLVFCACSFLAAFTRNVTSSTISPSRVIWEQQRPGSQERIGTSGQLTAHSPHLLTWLPIFVQRG